MLVKAMAPMGIGFKIKPTMVATKMANKCQACAVMPAGIGLNQMPAPTAIVASDLMTFEFKRSTPAFVFENQLFFWQAEYFPGLSRCCNFFAHGQSDVFHSLQQCQIGGEHSFGKVDIVFNADTNITAQG